MQVVRFGIWSKGSPYYRVYRPAGSSQTNSTLVSYSYRRSVNCSLLFSQPCFNLLFLYGTLSRREDILLCTCGSVPRCPPFKKRGHIALHMWVRPSVGQVPVLFWSMGDYRYTELSYEITSLISRTRCLGSSSLTNT